MPLGKIVPLERSPEEQRIWDWVSKLVYPNDKEILKRLPRYHFRVWLAAVDARAALIATDYQEFYDLLRYQNKKRWYHEVKDMVWRLIYGNRYKAWSVAGPALSGEDVSGRGSIQTERIRRPD